MNQRIRENVLRLQAYTPGEQPGDRAVIKLNTNENPYPPSPSVLAVLQQAGPDALRLYPDPVFKQLRHQIATLHEVSVDHVFCGNGSDEILSLCIRAFVPPHGRIGYFDPSYSLYPVLAAIADVATAPIPLNADFRCPDWPARYDVPLFFWTNPNAPTSLCCPVDALADVAEHTQGVLVIDEAYVDFADATALPLAIGMDNVLVSRTLSKAYSLAGIRLGYAVGHPELIEALYKIKDAYNINRLTQDMGCAAIADQAHMRNNVELICATRARVAEALRAKGFDVFPSQTNFLWLRPPRESATDLFQRLRENQVYTRYFPAPATAEYLRVTVGTDEQMDVFLALIK